MLHPDAVWDETYEEWVIPERCPCCERCWRYVSGRSLNRCVHGGPYKGYIEIPDT
jgi:hypothetical protein